MARKNDILYIRFETDGTAAKKPKPPVSLPKPVKKSAGKPRKAQKSGNIVIRLDPVAILGSLLAVIMLIMMVCGLVQMTQARRRADAASAALNRLEDENLALEESYRAGYDLEEVEALARAMGMVPADEVPQIPIQMEVSRETFQSRDILEWMSTVLAGLFA